MTTLIAIISIVAAVLQIILFFKLWGMTNDVRELRRMNEQILQKKQIRTKKDGELEKTQTATHAHSNIKISKGDYVIIKSTGQRLLVEDINGDRIFCNTGKFSGYKYFSIDEIEKES